VQAWLVLTATAGVALAARVATAPRVAALLPERTAAPAAEAAQPRLPPLDSLAETLVARDPFRIAHRPAVVAYDPERALQPPAPAAPKPVLILTGIVWDPRVGPEAVIDGLPGGGGPRVVRPGDRVGTLRVGRIDRDQVMVAGADTVWTLIVREPWR